MSRSFPVLKRKRDLVFLVLAAFGLLAVALLVAWFYREELKQVDLQALADRIAEKGPVPFFLAMSFLPAFWVPVSPFLVGSGALFSTEVAILGSAFSLAFNMAFCWLLSGKLLRPVFERLIARFGYSVPEFSKRNMIQGAFLLRITPGVPFPFQNYLLGLARMPFGWYMAVSLPPSLGYGICFILFGDALLEGNMKMILLSISLLVAVTFGVSFLRERLQRKMKERESK